MTLTAEAMLFFHKETSINLLHGKSSVGSVVQQVLLHSDALHLTEPMDEALLVFRFIENPIIFYAIARYRNRLLTKGSGGLAHILLA